MQCSERGKCEKVVIQQNNEKNERRDLRYYEKLLLKYRNKYKRIFNVALSGVLLVDREGLIIDANPAACNQLRLSREELISTNWRNSFSNIIHHDLSNREVTLLLKDQTEIIIEYSFAEWVKEQNIILFRDITANKKMLNELVAAKEQAEKANRAKSEFLMMMSHEFRTPLNSILGYSNIMLEDTRNSLNMSQQEMVKRIRNAGSHLASLINDLLSYSKLESKQLTLQIKDVSLPSLIEESIQFVLPKSFTKNVSIENMTSIPNDLYVRGDSSRVKQVLINLISNAIKYNRPGGKVLITSRITKSRITIFVHDTGIGIPLDQRKQILEPFYRIHHSEYNIEGSGLGLAIVKDYITMMGGSMGLRSKVHVGSSFWFSLPLSNLALGRVNNGAN